MTNPWQQIERQDRLQNDRVVRNLGISWLAFGLIGIVVTLVTGRPGWLINIVSWLALGAVMFIGAMLARRARRSEDRTDD